MFLDELENLFNILLESLLQHLVCFIKACYLQVRQLNGASFQQVNQPSRGGNDDVAAVSDLPHLLMNVAAAVHRHDLEIAAHAQGVYLCTDLDC